jgi:proliferating cell nuclear antigen PCNA
MGRVIDIEMENVGDFKTIIEILSGIISEANADFIRDADEHNRKLEQRKNGGKAIEATAEDDEGSDDDKKKKKIVKKEKNEKNEKNEKDGKKVKKQKDGEEEEEYATKEKNKGQIKILTADSNQIMLTFIQLKGDSFLKFNMTKDIYSVGLNLDELYKYIRNADREGIMKIYIENEDTQHIVFDINSDNVTSYESVCELRVLNIKAKKDKVIEANVAMAVRINCQAFHKACKDLGQFAEYIEITCDTTQFVITCSGDLSKHKRRFKANSSKQNGVAIKAVNNNNGQPEIIRLVFNIKYINHLYKCSSICDDMEIYLNHDSVMFFKYHIKLFAEVLVGIAPHTDDPNHNKDYNEENDQYYEDNEIRIK